MVAGTAEGSHLGPQAYHMNLLQLQAFKKDCIIFSVVCAFECLQRPETLDLLGCN